MREKKKAATRRRAGKGPAKPRSSGRKPAEEAPAVRSEHPTEDAAPPPGAPPKSDDDKSDEAVDLAVETVDALLRERGAEGKTWGSMIKQALKRRKPGFSESYYGFRSFNALLEEAERRGELVLDRDEKSGGYIVRLSASEE